MVKYVVALAAAFPIMMAATPGLYAQGENHWYNQFGDHSLLLSGVVIGGVSDLGAVFYNPGRLARRKNIRFDFQNTSGFQLVLLEVADGLGTGADQVERDFGTSPGFAAGAFRLPFWPDQTFAYSYLQRRNRDADIYLRSELAGDVLPPLPGEEIFVGSVEMASRASEQWGGLSWATDVSADVSIGLSLFGTVASREHSVELSSRAASDANVVSVSRLRQYELSTWGVLLKGGVAVDRGAMHFGLTFTTPQLQVRGAAETRFEDLLVGADTTGDGLDDDGFTSDRQVDLPATARTPAAIGLGMSWEKGAGIFHLSGEWYSGVERYTALETGPIEGSNGMDIGPYRVTSELKSVLNVGAGAEWRFSDALSAYASVASDASVAPDAMRIPTTNEEVSTNFLDGDATHFGAGLSASAPWLVVTVGATYAHSAERLQRPFPLRVGAENPGAIDIDTTTWRFLVGLSILLSGADEN